MHLLELAAQNVRGFSPSTRAQLPQGYIALVPPGAEPCPFGALTLALLYADGRGSDAAFVAPSAAGAGGKAALTFVGVDGQTYRVVRQLGGAGVLQRQDRASGAYAEVSRDALEISQYLRVQAGLPLQSVFEALFMLGASQLPSRRPAAKVGPAKPAAPKASLPSAQKVTAAEDIGQAEEKVRLLEGELEVAKQIDELQFRQDELSAQIFEWEERLKSTDGLRAALAEAEEAHRQAPTPESMGLPPDILSRVERYPSLVQKRDEALSRLEAEREVEAEAAARVSGIEPLYRDTRFVAGAAVGALCLGAGIFLEGSLRYLALLDIPAFGFAALVALKWVDDLQGSQRTGRKEGMLSAREKKLRDDFAAEAEHVTKAMAALGVETPAEILDVLARKALWAEKVQAFREQLQAAESDPAQQAAAKKLEALRRESEGLDGKLQALAGGYVRDPREVERELARVRESLELARAPAAATTEGSGGVEATAAAGDAAGGAGVEDPAPALLELAADLVQADVATVAGLIKDRCAQYLAALSDRRMLAVEFDHRGSAAAVLADRRVPVSDLPAKEADLVYLSLRLTLVEKLSVRAKLPLFIDDGLSTLDPSRAPLLGRMLKHLGTLTQVLHVAPPAPAAAVADASVPL